MRRRASTIETGRAGIAIIALALAACAATPSTTTVEPMDLDRCMVRICTGSDLECRRESRNQIYTSRNWRCLAGN